MLLINYVISLYFKLFTKCILVTAIAANQVPESKTTDTKYYVAAVTLSAQDNAKLLEQLQSGFKRTVNWNKCQFKKNPAQNRYLDFLINPSFQTANRLFVSSFK